MKRLTYHQQSLNRYFWRTHAQQEIDYIEESNGKMTAFEFKWSGKSRPKFSKSFLQAYPGTTTQVVHAGNFEDFLLPADR